MGAWGYGYFDDDAARDFMAEVEESYSPKEAISKALEAAVNADYLESDEGSAAIVAATYVDRQTNGTLFSPYEEGESFVVDSFPDRYPHVGLSDQKAKAILALQKVLGDRSELNELWAENKEHYTAWKEGLQLIIERLNN